MSDPVPLRNKPRPRRAEPIQPDAPWRGDDAAGGDGTSDAVPNDAPHDPAAGSADAVDRRAAEQEKQRSQDALDNVREGYR